MNNKYLSVLIIVSGILMSGAIIGHANAETTTQGDIQYPIPELGNCKNKSSCKVFCDDSKNSTACLTFAKQHNLMSQKELTDAKKFQDNGNVGPGGCKGQDACEQYCGNSTHMEECISFAKKNGMMSDQQLQESEKVLTAIKNGIKPPACSGPKQCNAYCSNPEHMEECMTFSISAGLMPEGQKVQMQKTLEAIKQGAKPPACQPTPPPDQLEKMLPGQTDQPVEPGQGLESCDTYCSTHSEECMSFALATGMVPDEEKDQMQKSLNAIKQGIKPPACRPKQPMNPNQSKQTNPNQPASQNNRPDQFGKDLQDCELYCADSSHVEECVKFSVAMGNMTEQQAQVAIKTGNKGPGGCIGRDACDAFCNNPDNQDTCFNFGKDNGMIPEADLQKMQDGQQKMKDNFSSIPPEVLDCITSTSGADVVEKMKTGSMIGRKDGDSINQCFQKFGSQERRSDQNQDDQGQQGRPNRQIQPWADMCSPDENGNPTSLACTDGDGNFVVSAKVGEDGKPVCPEGSTAKCGNYEQNNQRGPDDQNPGDNRGAGPDQDQRGGNFQPRPGNVNPGGRQMPQQAGPGGCKGPEECQKYCTSNPEECKNFQPQQNQQRQPDGGGPNQGQGFNPGSGQNGNGPGMNRGGINQNRPGQPNQQIQIQQPTQFNQGGQPNQQGREDPNVGMRQGVFSPGLKEGDCGTGPGTCLGIGPDDRDPRQFNQEDGQRGPMQPGQPNQFYPQNQFNQGGQPGPTQQGQPNQFNPNNQPSSDGQQFQFDAGQPTPMQQQDQSQMQQPFQPLSPAPMQQQPENPPPPVTSMMFNQSLMKMIANIFSILSPQNDQ